MKILIAPDKFKGTLSASEVAEAIERGIKKELPQAETQLLPMADGGEGTVGALVKAARGRTVSRQVTGPLGERIEAYFGLLPPSTGFENADAVIEMAAASGLHLVPPDRHNPLLATTYGTGELIRAALDHNPARIIVGIGGSATVDGGIGMAQALGVNFYDQDGVEIGRGGKELERIERIDPSGLDARLEKIDVLVASDVDNPLYGPSGAAHVYGPQKGATPEMIRRLDKGLCVYAQAIKNALGKDVSGMAGAGAAGGLGAGLVAFLGARLESGVELVIRATGLEKKLKQADLVITGEGKIDAQTAFGKVPAGVAELAKKHGIPVYAICGLKGEGAEAVYRLGVDKILALSDIADSLQDAYTRAVYYVEAAAGKLAKEIKA